MPIIMQIEDIVQLSQITDFIHDCWFDKAQIMFDSHLMVLEIPFLKESWERKREVKNYFVIRKYDVPLVEYKLKIQHVTNYQIIEGAQEGPGTDDMFNKIELGSDKTELLMRTAISKGIKITIRKLMISVEDTGRTLRHVARLSLF